MTKGGKLKKLKKSLEPGRFFDDADNSNEIA